jgi:hypothetical protein
MEGLRQALPSLLLPRNRELPMRPIVDNSSLGIPDEDTQKEEAGDAVVGESQNSDLRVENPYA